MEDAREITETLLANRTVVLNLEGLDVDIAQRFWARGPVPRPLRPDSHRHNSHHLLRRSISCSSKTYPLHPFSHTMPFGMTPPPVRKQSAPASKITPIKQPSSRRSSGNGMEVCVIKPTSVEDAREITETYP